MPAEIVQLSDGDDVVFDAVTKARVAASAKPIVVVAPHADEAMNHRAVDAGAFVAVLPSRLESLLRELERSADPANIARIQQFSAFYDFAPIGIVTTNLHGQWIYVNDCLCEQLGYTRAELQGKSFVQTTHPDDRRRTLHRFADVVAQLKEKTSVEKRYLRKDGSTMWANVTSKVARDANGGFDFLVTTIEDITPRHASEEEVRFQARLLACTEEAIIAVDLAGKVLCWNGGAERLFGWTEKEAIGKHSRELIRTSFSDQETDDISAFVRAGQSWSGDFDLTTRTGRTFPGACTASPIFDTNGELIGIVGILRDVSERHRGERTFARRYAQLEATTEIGRLALRGAPLTELFEFASSSLGGVLDAAVEINPAAAVEIRGDYPMLVLKSDVPVVILDRFSDRGIRSTLALRIASDREAPWGIIAVHSKTQFDFDVEDSLFIISVANVLGDAIHRNRSEMEMGTRAEQQSAIADLSRFVLATDSDKDVIEAACAVVGHLMNVEHPVYLKYDEDEDALFLEGGYSWLPAVPRRAITANGESLAGYVLKSGEAAIVADYATETRFDAKRIFTSHGIVSGIAAPVKGSRNTLGVIGAHARSARQFTSADAQFLTAIGNLLAQALERNEARRELAASESRHRAVFEGATEVIFAMDTNGVLTALNPAFEAVTGWSRDEWIGKPLRDAILLPDRERFDLALARLGAGESVASAEIRVRGKSRGILVEACAFVRGNEILGFARDITAARAAEEERRGLLAELQLVLDSTDEGIYTIDTEGRVTMLNRASAKILGYKPDDLYGMNIHQLAHSRRIDGSLYPAEACPVNNVLRTGRAIRGTDEVFWTSENKAILIDYSASPIVSDGLTRGVVVAFTDVTERRKLAAQLEQAKRLGSLGRLAATVAHEFNNVLMSISPFAEIARRDTTTARATNACEQILKAVRRGKGITEEILRFTQPSDPKLSALSTAKWLEAFAADAESILGNHYQIARLCDARLPDVLADANQLDQAFTNLVVNARDSMPEGGVIEIGARRESKSTVFSFGLVHNAEQYVHFWVRDGGTGMPHEVLQHIFEPLFTTKRNGTGLGLAVTHQVVKRHGGELFVESRVKRGTTFHLFLPIARAEAIATPVPMLVANSARARFHRVLIVEDEPAVADGIAAVLRLEGTEVTVVGTGAGALDVLSAGSPPDAVILDVGLPDMDGRKVYEQLLSIAPNLPVVFSTGHEREPRSELTQHTAWLMKPYELDVLLSALDTLAAQVEC